MDTYRLVIWAQLLYTESRDIDDITRLRVHSHHTQLCSNGKNNVSRLIASNHCTAVVHFFYVVFV
jgi:hypothetical protein